MIYVDRVRNNFQLASIIDQTGEEVIEDLAHFTSADKRAIVFLWDPNIDDYPAKFNHLAGICKTVIVILPEMSPALAARRLFVMFAGQSALQALQTLGFKTFSGIIDERYDFESDANTRYRMACEQVLALCNRDQSEVLELIQPIVEYNYNHLMTTDWNLPVRVAIQNPWISR